ncbi:MAG: hypothetical protein ACI97K_002569 [Glaciecola sp.]|jgi:hypothetical protein
MKAKISIKVMKTFSAGALFITLSTSVMASEPAGYVVTGDHKSGFKCSVTEGVTVQDLTLDDLNLAVGGDQNFSSISIRYAISKWGIGAVLSAPILDRSNKHFERVQKYNKKIEMRPLMHTKAVRCEIKTYATPKQAGMFSIKTPEKQEKQWQRTISTSNSQSVTLSTSSTSKITRTQTADANLGFIYKGLSGGVSGSTSKTTEQSLKSDFIQSKEHQNSETNTSTETLYIPKGEFYGHAPSADNLSYEVEVTFDSTFSGYAAFAVVDKNKAAAINTILNSKTSSDSVHLPPRYSSTKKITTIVTKVLYQPAPQWKTFDNEQDYDNNYDALVHNHFSLLSEDHN